MDPAKDADEPSREDKYTPPPKWMGFWKDETVLPGSAFQAGEAPLISSEDVATAMQALEHGNSSENLCFTSTKITTKLKRYTAQVRFRRGVSIPELRPFVKKVLEEGVRQRIFVRNETKYRYRLATWEEREEKIVHNPAMEQLEDIRQKLRKKIRRESRLEHIEKDFSDEEE